MLLNSKNAAGRFGPWALAALLLSAGPAVADDLRFWTTEEQPDRLAKQQAMAERFAAASGHTVEVIPVTEKDLGTRATAAYAAGDLPDVIYHTLQYALPWAEAGILDTDAATDVVETLGADTFASGALAMAAVGGGYASVPVDGWTQMVVYRKDLFDAAGLAAPTSYANVLAAIEALHGPPDMYGFVAATKVDENFMSQVLEHVFLANGVSPVEADGVRAPRRGDDHGGARLLPGHRQGVAPGRALLEAVAGALLRGQGGDDHLVAVHPGRAGGPPRQRPAHHQRRPHVLRARFEDRDRHQLRRSLQPGRGGLGRHPLLRDHVGRVHRRGDGLRALLHGRGLHPDPLDRPGRQVPGAPGTADNPTAFTEAWSMLPVGVDRKAPLGDLYAKEMIDEIVGGLDVAQRWGVAEGQLSLASKIINSQVINRLVREYIDGVRDASATVAALNEELAKVD